MSLTKEELTNWKNLDHNLRKEIDEHAGEFIDYYRQKLLDEAYEDIGPNINFRYVTNMFLYYTRPNGPDIVIPIECLATEKWRDILDKLVQEVLAAKTWKTLNSPMNLFGISSMFSIR